MDLNHVVCMTKSQLRYYRYYVTGMGVREIARACNVSAATVSRTLKKAIANMEKYGGDEDEQSRMHSDHGDHQAADE